MLPVEQASVTYPARFHRQLEEGEIYYFVDFPDLDGCFTDGFSKEEAMEMAVDVLGAWTSLLLKKGTELPPPSAWQEITCPDGFTSNVNGVVRDLDSIESIVTYPAQFFPAEDEQWTFHFPDLPQIQWIEETKKEAFMAAEDFLGGWIQSIQDKGQEIPLPSDLNDLEIPPGGFTALVTGIIHPRFNLNAEQTERDVPTPGRAKISNREPEIAVQLGSKAS